MKVGRVENLGDVVVVLGRSEIIMVERGDFNARQLFGASVELFLILLLLLMLFTAKKFRRMLLGVLKRV